MIGGYDDVIKIIMATFNKLLALLFFGLKDKWDGKNRCKPYHMRLSAIFCQCLLKMPLLPEEDINQVRSQKRSAKI